MSMTIMLAGPLAKQPEIRQSKNGNSYALASLRVQTAKGDLFASGTGFGDLAPTLAGLAKGDPVTIIGTGKLSTYQGKEGDTRAGLSVTASRIIALTDHQAAPSPRGNGQRRRMSDTQISPPKLPPIEAYNDPIPF